MPEPKQREDTGPMSWAKRWAGAILGVLACALAAILIYRLVKTYTLADIVDAVRQVPSMNIAFGAAFAAASYFCLSWFDWLALRYVGHPLPYRQAALASFTSLSIGHNIGFAGLSSGAIRYRFYSAWGLNLGDVAKLVVFCGMTVALGLATVAGLALLLKTSVGTALLGASSGQVRLLGAALLIVPLAYLAVAGSVDSIKLFRWHVEVPERKYAAAQIGVGTLNYLCVAACLHQMIAWNNQVGYADVAAAYVIANAAAIASHVPGGIGVLESVTLFLLPGATVLGALVMFRIVYYLGPLVLGLLSLAAAELLRRRSTDAGPARQLASQER